MQTEGRPVAPTNHPDIATVHMDRRRFMILSILGFGACYFEGVAVAGMNEVHVLDDFSRDDLISTLGTPWRGFSDQVMGGISQETIALTEIDGRRCLYR